MCLCFVLIIVLVHFCKSHLKQTVSILYITCYNLNNSFFVFISEDCISSLFILSGPSALFVFMIFNAYSNSDHKMVVVVIFSCDFPFYFHRSSIFSSSISIFSFLSLMFAHFVFFSSKYTFITLYVFPVGYSSSWSLLLDIVI